MKSKEEIKNMVAGRRYGKKWEDVLFKEDLFDEVLEEYAQQSQPSGMRWVKASERLPENGVGPLKYIWIRNIQTKAGGMQPLADYKKIDGIENTEWLDESSPAGAAEGANDVDYLG